MSRIPNAIPEIVKDTRIDLLQLSKNISTIKNR